MLAGYWQNLKINRVSGSSSHASASGWHALARYALEPSGYHAPELVLPILSRSTDAKLLLIENGSTTLMALPFVPGRFFDSSLTSALLASGVPHVTANANADPLTAFLKNQEKPFLFRAITSEGKFIAALKNASTHFAVVNAWQRAVIEIHGTFDSWMAENFDTKRRKEFKRLRNRLGEQGELKLEILSGSEGLDQFILDLLDLESAGWKGKRGTALKSDPDLNFAFRAAMINLAAAGKLRFWRLALNGKPIAVLYAIVEGDHAWLGKIAYDENFAKYSPGVMIILDATESFFAETDIRRVDSSAIPNHPMIDRIWRDRIAMVDVMVASERVSARKFSLILKAIYVKQSLRKTAKTFFYKLTKRKQS
jgi:CelD/BcsL family acetyltransferase involved in cellulose biosynthesis